MAILADTHDKTLVVTIDRPEVRNAVDRPHAQALAAAFRDFDADDSLAVAILTGSQGTFWAGADLKAAVAAVRAKHGDLPLLDRVKLVKLPAGTQGRILHVGPYDAEQDTIAKLQAFVQGEGYRLGARHIEVYLSDPQKVAPERIRTVIRYPLVKRR